MDVILCVHLDEIKTLNIIRIYDVNIKACHGQSISRPVVVIYM